MPYSPEMIILARESRGMTQKQLADASGVSQANISKYESGLVPPPDSVMNAIARTLRYPSGFFQLDAPLYGLGSSIMYHRRRRSTSLKDIRRLEALANVHRIRITPLLQGASIESPNGQATIPSLPISDHDDNVQRVAMKVRQALALPLGPVKNLVRTLETAGAVVILMPFRTPKFDGISQAPLGKPPVFFLNSESPTDRRRFTLAHELGHVVMHRQLAPDNAEEQADGFASEFLMPSQMIGPELSSLTMDKLLMLKAQWKVSMMALVRKARDLCRITERQYKEWNIKLSAAGYRRHGEPYPPPAEEPILVKRLLEVHQRYHGYSVDELEELMYASQDELVDTYGLVPAPPMRALG